ncbi:MAG: Fic family protein [Acholeplasmatales bacterium]|nr:Fic family protein [Acholeplasmatales bacterium]
MVASLQFGLQEGDNMDYKELLYKSIESDKYYTNTDLRMNRNYNYMLNNKELDEYLRFKEEYESNDKIDTSLLSWNSNKIYLYKSKELDSKINDYFEFFKNIGNDTNNEILLGIICSELEGTLKIEGVNTTRKQIEEIITKNNPKNQNDRIIINMLNGLNYVKHEKEFNKDTLKELYSLLSDGCLDKEDEIGNDHYRNDMVYVSNYTGCPVDKIDACMDSLFKFVNDNIDTKDPYLKILLPFIAHYYLTYIHPYFNYNGRTARMVQIWIFMLTNNMASLYLSEAINDNKNKYYEAIENTRNSRNDLTYFVTYLLDLINTYSVVQMNLDELKKEIENEGETISLNELHYLKRIMINKNIKWFNYKKFIEFEAIDITKQGALKILNKFVDRNFLISKTNSKNEKVFMLNDNILKYEVK